MKWSMLIKQKVSIRCKLEENKIKVDKTNEKFISAKVIFKEEILKFLMQRIVREEWDSR